MLNLAKIRSYIEGCPSGPWVQGAIGLRRVPKLSREIATANLSDPEVMKLWGEFMDHRGWDSREWDQYLREQHYAGFSEFRRYLTRKFGLDTEARFLR